MYVYSMFVLYSDAIVLQNRKIEKLCFDLKEEKYFQHVLRAFSLVS